MENENKLHLTDLIDVEILQQIQDAFSEMTDMASLTTDCNGIALTQGSNFTDFCMKHTRPSELGRQRCERCDINGAELTKKEGKSCAYSCHAGLVDFAAPIMANGEIVGSFIGGQVLVDPPDLHRIRETAVELGIDPDEYIEALKKVPVVSRNKVEKAAHFLYVIASTLSSIAYNSYELHKSNLEIEKASRMKSDFLANMSHEIRTPMNAVIGLADLALREEMPRAAREYVHQIKASGKNLLVIINDILDFSKIESGKMDIVEVEYEPLSIIQDLASIVNSRIGDKDIEFTMDIPPSLPKILYGDNVRIHQIILNLLTNAVKFTRQGEVHFKMDFERIDDETVLMKAEIRDTGIGIKQEDMHKLFNSFQQVDSKRNRNIEGTGLGLAISRQLLALMNGTITLESEYEKGTTFFFELPQKIIDPAPIVPEFDKTPKLAILIENRYVKAQLIRDIERSGTEYIDLADSSLFEDLKVDFLIVEKAYFSDTLRDFIKSRPDMQCIILVDYDSIDVIDIPNVRVISKPAYSMSLYNAMGIQDINLEGGGSENDGFSFIAPEAHILVVDDNSVNLTVATGLLEPLKMRIDTANSAAEAIEKIHHVKYDVIFMDHMMPEVDGVEATHIIRRLVPSYNGVPIIALTANAIGGAREMFIREGMNDFLAKPIDIKDALSKLRKWLPQEKILPADSDAAKAHTAPEPEQGSQSEYSVMDIKELNVGNALSLLGSEKLFRTVLKEYYSAIDKKSQTILDHKEACDWRNYAIEVHSLKSTSRQIGADALADAAAELEKAGNEQNTALINEKTDGMIKEYRRLKTVLKKYFAEEEDEQRVAEFEDIVALLAHMRTALDNFDTLQVDEEIEVMSKFKYIGESVDFFERLKTAAAEGDIGECVSIVDDWGKTLIDPENAGEKALGLLDELQEALDNFDVLGIDEAVEKMSRRSYPDDQKDFIPRLLEAAESSDIDKCSEIVSEWRALITQ
ncbi:MAG: PocR ligand-binding domain-containing protein [Lachnospiraceae bacterium]|nr:PocR ligand-binding domain-containing protein [Ruminococcus sp.]MCM1274454.1 PocR ligand-binding domain-containing protein [Lachnospiraceae bacterium]